MKLTVEQYKDALANALSENQINILLTLFNFPNSTATTEELTTAFNFKNKIVTNGQIGKIGKTIANYLKVASPLYWDGKKDSPAYFMIVGPYNLHRGKIKGKRDGWEMNDNLRKALEGLKSRTPQTAYIFVWNPKRWNWDEIENDIQQLNTTGSLRKSWKCGNTKSILIGDRIFLIKLGTEPKGIIGAGYATSTPYYQNWNEKNEDALFINVDFEALFNPDKEPILPLDILKGGNLSKQYSWTPQASGISIRPEIVEELESVWFDFLQSFKIRNNPFISSFVDIQKTLSEGVANQVLQTRYERNPYARKACLDHYGYSCSVCCFNFKNHYGQLGNNFIHVHHLTQVAAVGKRYEINPIADLRPVCPNCHAMLHKRNPPLTIDELKGIKKIFALGVA